MKFQEVAQYFDKIESEPSRIEMTKILAELFNKVSAEEAKIIAYLCLGQLNPPYIGTQFNFGQEYAKKVIKNILNLSDKDFVEKFKEYGDLGSILSKEGNWRKSSELKLKAVYERLSDIEKISGIGSQEKKSQEVKKLISELDPVSSKYIIRILTDNLRLGFSDMTLIDAFSWLITSDKSLSKTIEHAYNMCVDIGKIAYVIKSEGIEGIKNIQVEVGIPIRPALAERMNNAKEVIDKIGECAAQPKLDGFRLQIHIDNSKDNGIIKFYSRHLTDMSSMFPDLLKGLKKFKVDTLICEGEAIAYDPNTGVFEKFQETVKRRRKHGIEELAQELPLKLFLFDLLYFNGELYLKKEHATRREKLKEILKEYKGNVIQLVEEKRFKTAQDLEKYFMENIELGLEGLVVKKVDASYQPGKRNFNWIKLKRQEEGYLSDTIDCVILGYYFGSGKRADFGIGAFLVAIYNKKKDKFESIAKVGTGLKDEEWRDLKKKLDKIKSDDKPKNVECHKNLYPDVWVYPEIVCTVFADEITKSPIHTAGQTDKEVGYALRFPRFKGYRPDKSSSEASTIDEIKEMYDLQFKK